MQLDVPGKCWGQSLYWIKGRSWDWARRGFRPQCLPASWRGQREGVLERGASDCSGALRESWPATRSPQAKVATGDSGSGQAHPAPLSLVLSHWLGTALQKNVQALSPSQGHNRGSCGNHLESFTKYTEACRNRFGSMDRSSAAD